MVCPHCESPLAVAESVQVNTAGAGGQLRAEYLLRLRCPNRACPLGKAGTVLAEELRTREAEASTQA